MSDKHPKGCKTNKKQHKTHKPQKKKVSKEEKCPPPHPKKRVNAPLPQRKISSPLPNLTIHRVPKQRLPLKDASWSLQSQAPRLLALHNARLQGVSSGLNRSDVLTSRLQAFIGQQPQQVFSDTHRVVPGRPRPTQGWGDNRHPHLTPYNDRDNIKEHHDDAELQRIISQIESPHPSPWGYEAGVASYAAGALGKVISNIAASFQGPVKSEEVGTAYVEHKLGTLVSAPNNISLTFTNGEPNIDTSHGASGVMIVSHKEFFVDVQSSTAFTVSSHFINPGNQLLFPWLSKIAMGFEFYRFRKLKFYYVTSTNTSNVGSVMSAFDYDPTDAVPDGKAAMMDIHGAKRCSVWQSLEDHFSPALASKYNFYLVRSLIDSTPFPDPDRDCAMWFAATQGQLAAGLDLGEFYVEYEVELFNPQAPILPVVGNMTAPAVPEFFSATPAFPLGSSVTGSLPYQTQTDWRTNADGIDWYIPAGTTSPNYIGGCLTSLGRSAIAFVKPNVYKIILEIAFTNTGVGVYPASQATPNPWSLNATIGPLTGPGGGMTSAGIFTQDVSNAAGLMANSGQALPAGLTAHGAIFITDILVTQASEVVPLLLVLSSANSANDVEQGKVCNLTIISTPVTSRIRSVAPQHSLKTHVDDPESKLSQPESLSSSSTPIHVETDDDHLSQSTLLLNQVASLIRSRV